MPGFSEDEDLLQVPNPAEQARIRGAIKSNWREQARIDNINSLSPFARARHLKEDEEHIRRAQESGVNVDKAFINRISLEMGSAGSIRAAGPRKGRYIPLEAGAAGMVDTSTPVSRIRLEDGAAGSIAANRAYLARKKRGVGALAGASYGSPEMFPGKFPNIVCGPVNVGFGHSAGGANINILATAPKGFAGRSR